MKLSHNLFPVKKYFPILGKIAKFCSVLTNMQYLLWSFSTAAQNMKFFIKDFFSKYDQIVSFLRIWLHLINKSLLEICLMYSKLSQTSKMELFAKIVNNFANITEKVLLRCLTGF